jgi:hypothetical protein
MSVILFQFSEISQCLGLKKSWARNHKHQMTKHDGKWWISTMFMRRYFPLEDVFLVLENAALGLIPHIEHPESIVCE